MLLTTNARFLQFQQLMECTIREKTLEFSSMMLSAPSLYLLVCSLVLELKLRKDSLISQFAPQAARRVVNEHCSGLKANPSFVYILGSRCSEALLDR